jgi:hypothetical protein
VAEAIREAREMAQEAGDGEGGESDPTAGDDSSA